MERLNFYHDGNLLKYATKNVLLQINFMMQRNDSTTSLRIDFIMQRNDRTPFKNIGGGEGRGKGLLKNRGGLITFFLKKKDRGY